MTDKQTCPDCGVLPGHPHEPTAFLIFGHDGRPRAFGWNAFSAWLQFFAYSHDHVTGARHVLPIEEATRAYQAIGYRCAECRLVEVVAGLTRGAPDAEI